MKKTILLSSIVVMVIFTCNAASYADCSGETAKIPVKMQKEMPQHYKPMHPHHPSKAEMDAKKAEFEKRLNLTEEQKKQIEENRVKDHEKIKPFIDQKMAKKAEIKKLREDSSLSAEEKAKKIGELRKEIREINLQERKVHEENMKNFEALLTEKQKKEFDKIRVEQKSEMEKRKKAFEKGKYHKPHYGMPVQPKIQPVNK